MADAYGDIGKQIAGSGPKFTETEVFMGTICMVVLDLIDWLAADLPIADIAFPFEQYYLRQKGIKGTYALVGNILELIPFADLLPLRTIAFLGTAWVDRHPDLEALTEKLSGQVANDNLPMVAAGTAAGQGAGLAATGGAATEGGGVAPGSIAGGAASGEAGAVGTTGTTGFAGESESPQEPGQRTGRRRGEGPQEGEEGETGDGEEKEKQKSLEDRQLDTILKGRQVEEIIEKNLSAEGILSEIESPPLGAKVLGGAERFRPDQAIQPKAAPRPAQAAAANEAERYNIRAVNDNDGEEGEEIDLRKKNTA